MNTLRDSTVHMIPLASIEVVNPRERGKSKFRQIVDNIAHIGLKKPITVTPKHPERPHGEYYLVCGQGRLEAYRTLGQTEIPALIIAVTREQLYLMSLVENLARRQHTPIELLGEINALRARNYSFVDIAKKTDLDVTYVRGIAKLLKKGEERLLKAVEQGQIPLSIAMTIAVSEDHEVQRALAEAYESNKLRGTKLLAARKLIEKRRTAGKGLRGRVQLRSAAGLTGRSLLKTYEVEAERQRIIIHKAKFCETRLLVVVSALRQLFADGKFVALLRDEQLDEAPAFVLEQITASERTA
jgi:ParB family chromosome partitioning protein